MNLDCIPHAATVPMAEGGREREWDIFMSVQKWPLKCFYLEGCGLGKSFGKSKKWRRAKTGEGNKCLPSSSSTGNVYIYQLVKHYSFKKKIKEFHMN